MGTSASLKLFIHRYSGKFSRRQMDEIYIFFPEDRVRHSKQIGSFGDILLNPIGWEKSYFFFQMSSAKNLPSMLSVNL